MKRCKKPTGLSSVLIELQSRRVKVNRRAGRTGMKDAGGEGRGKWDFGGGRGMES